MQSILSQINRPDDVKQLTLEQLQQLAQELRKTIIHTVSLHGGHLASNLGTVELTLALYCALNLEQDKIVFDVGHQAYSHKLLSGRRERFSSLRTHNGISGFPKRSESPYDHFNTGHASTSVSAALGMARARDLKGTGETVVALIGDGALTGGMAYEALNDAGQSRIPLIVLLNDNGMSIRSNVGALNRHLNKIRSSSRYQSFKRRLVEKLDRFPNGIHLSDSLERFKNRIKYFLLPNVFFESLGFTYLGPVNGHDISAVTGVVQRAKQMQRPVVIHAVTTKGKGYLPAQNQPERYHGIGPFQEETGEPVKKGGAANSDAFGAALCELAATRPDLVAVSAAMITGTGLSGFAARYPDRCFDVGIAEQHAVTMAAGMAEAGLRPVVAIYSSFLQRAYDQILHDVCLQQLPVILGVDRAGLVGEDGETHHGIYDIAYFMGMPWMTVFSPSTQCQLRRALQQALEQSGPVAIRYGRGALPKGEDSDEDLFRWKERRPIGRVNIIASGRMMQAAAYAAKELDLGLIEACCLKPLDMEMLARLDGSELCVTLEDGVIAGGFGSAVAAALSPNQVWVERFGIPDNLVVQQGSIVEQDILCGISAQQVKNRIERLMEGR